MRPPGRGRRRRRAPGAGARGDPDLLDELAAEVAERVGAGRLGQNIDRAETQRLQREVRAVLGQRTHHDHRHRMALHDQPQERQAIHLRHFEVQGQHIGLERGDLFLRKVGIRRSPHDFDIGIGAQGLAGQASDDDRVIDDEHADFLSGHRQERSRRR